MIDITSSIDELSELFRQASAAVMRIYDQDSIAVVSKDDDSPLTAADTASNDILLSGLQDLYPAIPIISEEADAAQNAVILSQGEYWLVDPLDGTKEFINRNGQFVVCAGLIQDNMPIFGIVIVPTTGMLYYGGPSIGSFKLGNGIKTAIHVSPTPTGIIMGSRSHANAATDEYISAHYPDHEVQALGSLLKFLEIAEGNADAFPRLDHGMKLWDVAAGHAILSGAGGSVSRPDGSPLDYREPSFLIGDFVASSHD